MSEPGLAFVRHFADLPDPRVERTKKHALTDILVVAVCAVICGADSFEAIERYGRLKLDWLRQFVPLTNGVPSHDTFNRVLGAIDRTAFAAGFGRWMAALGDAAGLRQIAIDGKALRGAPADTFAGCLYLVNAWATENHLFLGQEAVADGSHEIAAVPALLRVLELEGALVTLDAAGCQKAIAQQIRARGGDYLLAVKGNQPALHAAVVAAVDRAADADFAGPECDTHATDERGHGRAESRVVTVVADPDGLPDEWPDVAAVVVVARERTVGRGEPAETLHYYLTSRRGTAAQIGAFVRGHWGVENGLHWCLDVAFGEDGNRTRDANAGANLGALRRVAASLLQQDPGRGSAPTKRLAAALDEQYLLKVLHGFKPS
jgi:predicted transposase YbfD/YdcC